MHVFMTVEYLLARLEIHVHVYIVRSFQNTERHNAVGEFYLIADVVENIGFKLLFNPFNFTSIVILTQYT